MKDWKIKEIPKARIKNKEESLHEKQKKICEEIMIENAGIKIIFLNNPGIHFFKLFYFLKKTF